MGLAWVGYDLNPHPLSRFETGGRAALPIWVSYMQRAVEGRPEPEFSPPEELELEKRTVDTRTGKLASSASKTAAVMWFKKGTAPEEVTQDKKVVDPNQFMQVPN